MHNAHNSIGPRIAVVLLVLSLFVTVSAVISTPSLSAQEIIFGPDDITPELRSREALLVYKVNLQRIAAGVPPLRWNRELSEAAQWFAWDTVENLFDCDSVDSQARSPGARLRAFGYTGMITFREMVACGFTEPYAATMAWMSNSDQRSYVLDPNLREAGAGYYYSVEKKRGYIVLDLSADRSYGPVIINNEAPDTLTSNVNLYLHPQPTPAVEMKISNEPNFGSAKWEAVTEQRAWQLAPGEGFRTVYVLTRDALGATTLVTDTIYVGAELPKNLVSLDQASNIGSAYGITTLPTSTSAGLRLSQGWVLEDSDPSFNVLQGESAAINDSATSDGRSTTLYASYREGLARASTVNLPVDRLLAAFFRLKVGQNAGDAEVARVSVVAGGVEHGPLILHGSDFPALNEYYEFHVDFASPQPPLDRTVEVRIRRTGEADVSVDVVRFFGQPMNAALPVVWPAGANTVRSQGLWGRVETQAAGNDFFDVVFAPLDHPETLLGEPRLKASPDRVVFKSADGLVSPINEAVVVCGVWCNEIDWTAMTNAPWLRLQQTGEGLILSVDATGLTQGVYYAQVNVTPTTQSSAVGTSLAPTAINIELQVDGAEPLTEEEIVSRIYLPVTTR